MRKKQAGFTLPKGKEAAEPARNVINLMDALRRSVQTDRAPQAGKANAPDEKPKKGRKRAAGQTELLLPIQGKGAAREAAAAKPRPAAKKVAGRRKAG